jgi:hypothetical protein
MARTNSPGGDNARESLDSGVSDHINWGAVRGALARINPDEAR